MLGLIIFGLVLVLIGLDGPADWWNAASPEFLFLLGSLALWRYGWGLVHLCRSLLYRHRVFPRMRRQVEALGDAALPSHVYLLITSFRISAATTERVYRGAIEEAMRSGLPCTVVASVVDVGDEWLVRRLFARLAGGSDVRLRIVRIAGTGKRDALAEGFRLIARDRPADDAAVCVIDGDSILEPGLLRSALPLLACGSNVAALTTDEVCEVEGNRIFRDWYNMRFAQRQILMSSMGLSRRVLTLTGRMSAFKAKVVCDPAFIAGIEHDYIDHWRFGRLKLLTGDDKSSWFHILRSGQEMLYVPDVRVTTIESPPNDDFGIASTQLMVRWFGNMLRTNGRALALGPGRMGLFTWWAILDQRISMWTALAGLAFALLSLAAGYQEVALAYLYWIALTRFAQTLILLTARRTVSWTYPFLLYYNQIYGSLIKTYMIFHLDRQKWTRQKTVLSDRAPDREKRWIAIGSSAGHALALLALILSVGLLVGLFNPVALAETSL